MGVELAMLGWVGVILEEDEGVDGFSFWWGLEEEEFRFENMLTLKEILYPVGILLAWGARQEFCLWPIRPQSVQYTSNLSYFSLIQVVELSFLVKRKPRVRGLLTSISTRSLRKLRKVVSTPLAFSISTRFPKPFPIAMEFFKDMLFRGSPWTWIQKGTVFRESSPSVAVGDQACRAIKIPFTFQTGLRILVMCSFSENLKR